MRREFTLGDRPRAPVVGFVPVAPTRRLGGTAPVNRRPTDDYGRRRATGRRPTTGGTFVWSGTRLVRHGQISQRVFPNAGDEGFFVVLPPGDTRKPPHVEPARVGRELGDAFGRLVPGIDRDHRM